MTAFDHALPQQVWVETGHRRRTPFMSEPKKGLCSVTTTVAIAEFVGSTLESWSGSRIPSFRLISEPQGKSGE
jgi:hypothetical protein